MPNQRFVPRSRKRLPLELGLTRAFTADLSPGGFCVELPRTLPPGTSVVGALVLGEERFEFTGLVTWAKQGEPRLGVRSRLGVKFTGIANAFFASCVTLFAT